MFKRMRIFFLVSIFMLGAVSVASAAAFRVGDEGSEVLAIQKQLANLGYDVPVDGDYGPATVDAVKSFQNAQGMESNGLVGSATYSALLGKTMPASISRGSNYVSRAVLSESMNYLGVPYVFGGTTPSGFDCSGYVRYVFAKAGIQLPRTADAQYEMGTPVATSELVPGDLVFFSTYEPGASHVGIYLGNDKFINASSSSGVSVASLHNSYWNACYIGARRVL